MSYHVFFAFSTGIRHPLTAPPGTKAAYLAHIEAVEDDLGLKRIQYRDNPVHWDWPRRYEGIDDEVLCETVERHNRWVRRAYADFQKWAKKPIEGWCETITPEDASRFWHGLQMLDVPAERWTDDYYRGRMEVLYDVMRGRDSEGISFDEPPLTPKQAGAVIRLFSQFLDPSDLRLDVPRDCDHLASSYHGEYRWCERCGAVDDLDGGVSVARCTESNCPLQAEDREYEEEDPEEAEECR